MARFMPYSDRPRHRRVPSGRISGDAAMAQNISRRASEPVQQAVCSDGYDWPRVSDQSRHSRVASDPVKVNAVRAQRKRRPATESV